MLSNVSANRMKFLQNGEEKYYIQIGTVMTDEDYRKQGLASGLIKHVISEYENECDGIYLFGNPDAIGFYEKMGFKTVSGIVSCVNSKNILKVFLEKYF